MAGTQYPKLRRALTESLRASPDNVIERAVAAQGLRASSVEDFWDSLGNFVASALPAVGGAVGSVIAPGVGTAIGAGLGSAAGSALHAAIGPGQQPAPARAAAAPAPAPVSSQQATAQLLQLLAQPQLLQALMQMLLGSAGSATVPVPVPMPAQVPAATAPVGASPAASVPVSAFTNLLSTLATQASEAYNAERGVSASAGVYHYGAGPWGSVTDLASPDSRAEALMNLLREGGAAREARALRRQKLTRLAEALRAVDGRPAVALG
jgi:hypothetical protein